MVTVNIVLSPRLAVRYPAHARPQVVVVARGVETVVAGDREA
jgi:hypothetical protein